MHLLCRNRAHEILTPNLNFSQKCVDEMAAITHLPTPPHQVSVWQINSSSQSCFSLLFGAIQTKQESQAGKLSLQVKGGGADDTHYCAPAPSLNQLSQTLRDNQLICPECHVWKSHLVGFGIAEQHYCSALHISQETLRQAIHFGNQG